MTALPQPMRDRDVLREHAEGEARVLAEGHALTVIADPRPVVLEDYVQKVFDGAIGDHDMPFKTQDDARLAVEFLLRERARRDLNKSELVKIGIVVAIEWNRRIAAAAPEKLAAFMGRSEVSIEDLADQRAMHREEYRRAHGEEFQADGWQGDE